MWAYVGGLPLYLNFWPKKRRLACAHGYFIIRPSQRAILWSPTFFSNFVLTFSESVSTYSCSRQIIRGFSKIFKIEEVRALSVRSIYKGENAWHPLWPLGTPWDPLRQFYMYVFQMLIARSVGARLTSKSLQNSFHAKENRIRPCCFWRVTDISPLFLRGWCSE